ncbi:AAA family ATPase [Rugamonas fusca]|nr:AAA family ATPase [Rugamonas fusca]
MLKKILEIENVGPYSSNPVKSSKDWNGEFKSKNIIYGENGVGKTTLALILTSLHGDDNLLKEKRTIGSSTPQKLRILMADGSIRKYTDNKWDKHCSEINVFDVHYIEDNVYIGSSLLSETRNNLFQIIAGEEGIQLKKKLEELYGHLNDFRRAKTRIKNELKSNENLTQDVTKRLQEDLKFYTAEIKYKTNHIRQVNVELGEYSQKTFENNIEIINKYLRYFTPHIRLEKFSKSHSGPRQLVSYSLSVSGEIVGFHGLKGGSGRKIKYSLSEGDKSAFAFSFFLAQLEKGDLSKKIVVFDDPISSFDQARRNATINQLMRISSSCLQLFVSTHDINFAKALARKFEAASTVNLKISKNSSTSHIVAHDIENETLSGVFKDIKVLSSYLNQGASSELEKREVIRCIRPILEGILRIKYFNEIERGEWLGDMLGKIDKSTPNDRLFRLKDLVPDIGEINDYSKEFHHSDPTSPWGDTINDEELRIFVRRTLQTIDQI